MEQLQNDVIYTVQQIAKLMQLTPKTVRTYLKRYGFKPMGNRYRLMGTDVKELLNKVSSKSE